jgi:holo-[acyl-carrier protein] synthase
MVVEERDLPVSIIGVGIDLVDLGRVRRMLDRHGDRLLRRVLTAAELEYVRDAADPVPHLAARLAAKEAAFKALQALPGARAVSWLDLEVIRGPQGAPSLALRGRALEVGRATPGLGMHLSLTHSDWTAGAVAIAEVQPSNS